MAREQGYFASIFALDRHSGRWHKWHFLSYITPHSRAEVPPGLPGAPEQGLPGLPDQGLPGLPGLPDQGFEPGAPDQGLPGRPPWEKPGDRPAWPPGPIDPDWGVDAPVTPEHPIYIDDVKPGAPDQGLPPGRPTRPVRPEEGTPEQGLPGQPDQGLPGRQPRPPQASTQPLPPGAGGRPGPLPEEQPPVDPQPGEIWPPLPSDSGCPPGKHAFRTWIPGVGHRYIVANVPAATKR